MENQYSTRRDFIKQAGAGLVSLAGLAGLLTAGALTSGCTTISKKEPGKREIIYIQPVEIFSKDGINEVYCVEYSNGEHTVYMYGDKEISQIVEAYERQQKRYKKIKSHKR